MVDEAEYVSKWLWEQGKTEKKERRVVDSRLSRYWQPSVCWRYKAKGRASGEKSRSTPAKDAILGGDHVVHVRAGGQVWWWEKIDRSMAVQREVGSMAVAFPRSQRTIGVRFRPSKTSREADGARGRRGTSTAPEALEPEFSAARPGDGDDGRAAHLSTKRIMGRENPKGPLDTYGKVERGQDPQREKSSAPVPPYD
ncbi:hypothetical protein DCS_03217 [Drechmeria coniospora]|uniref:Uncharacterized protein n=1 Tax=Drechmeria coniospora TaxID=98403 RepID=A0A151GYG2_DRECN|nr:hypothetical protein DCS_03217 [Drechmeria coniospora]KYK62072.1 hypothetical protein DCS_03217 [Drechmeria coniospora]